MVGLELNLWVFIDRFASMRFAPDFGVKRSIGSETGTELTKSSRVILGGRGWAGEKLSLIGVS